MKKKTGEKRVLYTHTKIIETKEGVWKYWYWNGTRVAIKRLK